MLVDLFAVDWDGGGGGISGLALPPRRALTPTGWHALGAVAPFAAAVSVLCVAIWWLSATRRSPALPTVLTTLLLPVAGVLTLLVAWRGLLDPPTITVSTRSGGQHALSQGAGSYAGLGLSLLMTIGLYLSLRREGVGAAAPEVETLTIGTAAERRET